ncbi:hypothetical protein FNV43_RR00028 [Rhamnella rubrinervis]|uniref:Uncharacterized protein n=1 Tax=Rhamnella rubrinervis TaxID=2594499 RepID=A0A8K0MRI3_9ROSA|nr:hypothetical protein FNV43_RR00028 [Rhamnella rubrinervis]
MVGEDLLEARIQFSTTNGFIDPSNSGDEDLESALPRINSLSSLLLRVVVLEYYEPPGLSMASTRRLVASTTATGLG